MGRTRRRSTTAINAAAVLLVRSQGDTVAHACQTLGVGENLKQMGNGVSSPTCLINLMIFIKEPNAQFIFNQPHCSILLSSKDRNTR